MVWDYSYKHFFFIQPMFWDPCIFLRAHLLLLLSEEEHEPNTLAPPLPKLPPKPSLSPLPPHHKYAVRTILTPRMNSFESEKGAISNSTRAADVLFQASWNALSPYSCRTLTTLWESLLDVHPSADLLGQEVDIDLICCYHQGPLQDFYPSLHSHQQCVRAPTLPHSANTRQYPDFASLVHVKRYLAVNLTCLFLSTSEFEHFFIFLLAFCLFPFCEFWSRILAHFPLRYLPCRFAEDGAFCTVSTHSFVFLNCTGSLTTLSRRTRVTWGGAYGLLGL